MPDAIPLDAFLDAVAALEVEKAERIVDEVAAGHGIDDAVARLLAPAQHDVARRLEFGEWTDSQQHAAAAIIDSALRRLAPPHAGDDAPTMALLCAAGERHVTPARMAALRLHNRGWRITILGAAGTPDDLGEALRGTAPAVVGISCTAARNLPGARRTIEVVHALGLPVVVGGAALGSDPRRARAIGADAGGGSFDELSASARSWVEHPPALQSGVLHHRAEVDGVRRRRDALAAAGLAALTAESVWLIGALDLEMDRTTRSLHGVVEHLAISLEVDDAGVLDDAVARMEGPLLLRGERHEALLAALSAMERELGEELPVARARLRAARSR